MPTGAKWSPGASTVDQYVPITLPDGLVEWVPALTTTDDDYLRLEGYEGLENAARREGLDSAVIEELAKVEAEEELRRNFPRRTPRAPARKR